MKAKFTLNFSCFVLIFLVISTSSCLNNSVKSETLGTSTIPVPSNTPEKIVSKTLTNGAIILNPSTIVEDLEKYQKANPQISTAELAKYGNSLLPQKGFNYNIDVGDLIEKKTKTKDVKDFSEDKISFNHQMVLSDNSKQFFQIIAPKESNCCCGYTYADFPVLNITAGQMTLVAEGKTFTVKRTKEFSVSEEYVLVDTETMRKEIRKWQMPDEGFPSGISKDGKSLYINVFEDSDLILEIFDDGNLRFGDRKDFPSAEGVLLENHPTDKDNAYLAFMRFDVGNKSYVVRFSGPCT